MADNNRFLDYAGLEHYHEKVKELVGDIGTYTNTDPTVTAIGGIPAGTTFENMALQDVLTKLLYPYVRPTVSSLNVTPSGGVFEVGTTITITRMSATVTKKSSPIARVDFLRGGSEILHSVTDVAAGGAVAYAPTDLTVDSNTTFAVRAVDSEATPGVATSANVSFTFVHALYFGTTTEGTVLDAETIKAMNKVVATKSNRTYNYNLMMEQAVYAYPTSYGNITSITDPNGFDVTSDYNVSTITIDSVPYTVIRANSGAWATDFALTFKF